MKEYKIRLGRGIGQIMWNKSVIIVEEFDEDTNSMESYTYDIGDWVSAYNKMVYK